MREYARISPAFWTGKTGKQLRAKGHEAVVVALYLMTSPHSNMIGLYYLPKMYLAYETGLGEEGASKGLAWAIEAGFCEYDEATETIWVREMAAYQIGDQLSADDKRCKGVQRDFLALPNNPFLGAFYERYEGSFHLTQRHANQQGASKPLRRPSKAPAKQGKGEGEGTGEGAGEGDARIRALPPELLADYMKVRKAKRAGEFTATAIDGMEREAASVGLSLEDAMRYCCEAGWQGFNANWYAERQAKPRQSAQAKTISDLTGGLASVKGAGNALSLA